MRDTKSDGRCATCQPSACGGLGITLLSSCFRMRSGAKSECWGALAEPGGSLHHSVDAGRLGRGLHAAGPGCCRYTRRPPECSQRRAAGAGARQALLRLWRSPPGLLGTRPGVQGLTSDLPSPICCGGAKLTTEPHPSASPPWLQYLCWAHVSLVFTYSMWLCFG